MTSAGVQGAHNDEGHHCLVMPGHAQLLIVGMAVKLIRAVLVHILPGILLEIGAVGIEIPLNVTQDSVHPFSALGIAGGKGRRASVLIEEGLPVLVGDGVAVFGEIEVFRLAFGQRFPRSLRRCCIAAFRFRRGLLCIIKGAR